MRRIVPWVLSVLLLAGALAGCAEPSEPPPSPEPAPTQKTVTITDEDGHVITGIPCPPQRIASLNPAVTETLCALGAQDRIVLRTYDTQFPPSIIDLPAAGESKDLDLEAVVAMAPDVVICRTRTDPAMVEKLEAAGIPVLLFWSIDMTEILPMITQMGVLLDEEEQAAEFRGYIEGHLKVIDAAVVTLPEEEKPLVFYQTINSIWKTTCDNTSGHRRLVRAGAINIAGELEGKMVTLSPEFIVEQDPDIIVHSLTYRDTWAPPLEIVQGKYEEMVGQPELQLVSAIKNDRVHVIFNRLLTGPRTIIGLLYYIKWFHPDKVPSLDPAAVHAEMLQKYWGIDIEGVWTYPE